MNTVITNPPAKASTANNDESFVTVVRDRLSGIRVRETSVSRSGDNLDASTKQMTAPIGNSRNQARPVGVPVQNRWTNAGPPASSAPNAPARYATALYRPNTRSRTSAGACPIIDCSNVVSGPFSFASVESTPSNASTIKIQSLSVAAYAAPTSPINRSKPLYVLRRPHRSPSKPTVIAAIAIPARIAAPSRPTATSEAPEAASEEPRI